MIPNIPVKLTSMNWINVLSGIHLGYRREVVLIFYLNK